MKTALLILAVFLFFFSTSSDAASAPSLGEPHKNRNPILKPTFTGKTCKETSDCKPLGFGYSCDPSTKTCRKYI